MSRITLEDWMTEAWADGENGLRGEGVKVTMFSLVHMRGENEIEIHSIPSGRWGSLSDAAATFQRKASGYSQDLEGPQTFQLLAFYGSKQNRASHPFVVLPEKQHNGLATEGPHSNGLTQQAMRHTEAMMNIMTRQTEMLFATQAKTLELLARENQSLRQENAEAAAIVKEVVLNTKKEDHAMRIETLKIERSMKDRDGLLRLAPALVNTITGKQVFPQGTADTALIESIVEGLSKLPPEKLMTAVEALAIPAELLAPLMARAEEIMKRKAEEAKRLAEVATIPVENPEANAGGEA